MILDQSSVMGLGLTMKGDPKFDGTEDAEMFEKLYSVDETHNQEFGKNKEDLSVWGPGNDDTDDDRSEDGKDDTVKENLCVSTNGTDEDNIYSEIKNQEISEHENEKEVVIKSKSDTNEGNVSTSVEVEALPNASTDTDGSVEIDKADGGKKKKKSVRSIKMVGD